MTGDGPREFVDANVLVYAFDSSAGDKKTWAEALLARGWSAQDVSAFLGGNWARLLADVVG